MDREFVSMQGHGGNLYDNARRGIAPSFLAVSLYDPMAPMELSFSIPNEKADYMVAHFKGEGTIHVDGRSYDYFELTSRGHDSHKEGRSVIEISFYTLNGQIRDEIIRTSSANTFKSVEIVRGLTTHKII